MNDDQNGKCLWYRHHFVLLYRLADGSPSLSLLVAFKPRDPCTITTVSPGVILRPRGENTNNDQASPSLSMFFARANREAAGSFTAFASVRDRAGTTLIAPHIAARARRAFFADHCRRGKEGQACAMVRIRRRYGATLAVLAGVLLSGRHSVGGFLTPTPFRRRRVPKDTCN